jgi:nicotinate-nucleotide adenylyltransferase
VPDRPAAVAGPRSIGILGGTFNPPHLGHVAVADHARSALGLELVLLTPAHIPPHKPTAPDPGSECRLAMCRLAVDGADGVAVCTVELERGGPSYTVDTLRSIHASHPHAELTFIVGADVASTLPSWREPRELLELADLAVAARAGSDRAAVVEAVAGLRGGPASEGAGRELPVRFLDMAEIEISSSMVRRRVAAGESIEELVGPAVARYIAEHDLYRGGVGAIA